MFLLEAARVDLLGALIGQCDVICPLLRCKYCNVSVWVAINEVMIKLCMCCDSDNIQDD